MGVDICIAMPVGVAADNLTIPCDILYLMVTVGGLAIGQLKGVP